MPRFLLGLAGCFLLAGAPSPVLARTWTDQEGRNIEGDFVRVSNGSVVLVRGIQVFAVPFESFCPADQDYVRRQVQHLPPAATDASKATDPAGDDAATKSDPKDLSPAVASASTPDTSAGKHSRTWTDLLGRHLMAEYVSWTGKATDVVVLRKGSESMSIAFSKFSVADQEYLRKTAADKAAVPSAASPVTAPHPSQPAAKLPTTPRVALPATLSP